VCQNDDKILKKSFFIEFNLILDSIKRKADDNDSECLIASSNESKKSKKASIQEEKHMSSYKSNEFLSEKVNLLKVIRLSNCID
jgi:hypothetical protein